MYLIFNHRRARPRIGHLPLVICLPPASMSPMPPKVAQPPPKSHFFTWFALLDAPSADFCWQLLRGEPAKRTVCKTPGLPRSRLRQPIWPRIAGHRPCRRDAADTDRPAPAGASL